jgi:hypothetical protein
MEATFDASVINELKRIALSLDIPRIRGPLGVRREGGAVALFDGNRMVLMMSEAKFEELRRGH